MLIFHTNFRWIIASSLNYKIHLGHILNAIATNFIELSAHQGQKMEGQKSLAVKIFGYLTMAKMCAPVGGQAERAEKLP